MPKPKKDTKQPSPRSSRPAGMDIDEIMKDLEQNDIWEMTDPNDQAFWEEFFQIEDLLEMSDELDPPKFTVSVHNHRTGVVKTYNNIKLKSTRKKIAC